MFSHRLQPLNFLAILFLGWVLCGLQTTFWFQLFGRIPSPNFFILLILYLALFRKRWLGLAQVYLLGPIVATFTITPHGVIWLEVILIYLLASYAKERVFWPNWRYYMIASLGIILGHHVLLSSLSWFFEFSRPLEFWQRSGEILLTVLVAPGCFTVFALMDRFTIKEIAQEGPRHG